MSAIYMRGLSPVTPVIPGWGGGSLGLGCWSKENRRKIIRNSTRTILGRPCSMLPCDCIIVTVPRDQLGGRKSHIEKVSRRFVRTVVSSHDIVTCMSRGPLILGSGDMKMSYHVISY